MKVWIIEDMDNKARLCISIDIDDENPQLLLGPHVLDDEQRLNAILVKANELLTLYQKKRSG